MTVQQREFDITLALTETPGLTRAEIAEACGGSDSQIKHAIRRMLADRKIHVSGERKPTGKPGSTFGAEYSVGASLEPPAPEATEKSLREIITSAREIGGPFGILAAQLAR